MKAAVPSLSIVRHISDVEPTLITLGVTDFNDKFGIVTTLTENFSFQLKLPLVVLTSKFIV